MNGVFINYGFNSSYTCFCQLAFMALGFHVTSGWPFFGVISMYRLRKLPISAKIGGERKKY